MESEYPLMAQYFAIKKENMDAVLLFQVGGFYQTYYYDAELAARILQLRMVSRAIGGGKQAPMCGFPKAAGKKYAGVFAENGSRVILCAQTGEKDEQGRAVRRIVETVEPQTGTVVEFSGEWKEYLRTHTFEGLQPSKRGKIRSKQEHVLLDELESLDLDRMTPMEALQVLHTWRQRYCTNRV